MVTVEPGIRYDHSTGIGDAVLSPRVAWTIKPSATTTVAGSVGRFGDKVPLLALAFPWLPPARSIELYDGGGVAVAPPQLVTNMVGTTLVTPVAQRWNVELDQHFKTFLFRTRYEERHGHDEFVVDAIPGATVLMSGGSSSERSLEVTAGYQGHGGGNFYVWYVRAATHGNVNSLDTIEGVFRTPFVQPDQIGPLPADAPNRVLAGGAALVRRVERRPVPRGAERVRLPGDRRRLAARRSVRRVPPAVGRHSRSPSTRSSTCRRGCPRRAWA